MAYLKKLEPLVTTSERALLKTHITIAGKIKCFKKLFVKGVMIKTFEYINWLYAKKKYVAILRVIEQLSTSSYQPSKSYKAKELIRYCEFLLSDVCGHCKECLDELIASLNTTHELGQRIEKEARKIACSE